MIEKSSFERKVRAAAERVHKLLLTEEPGTDELDIEKEYGTSLRALRDYSTLHWPHIETIGRVRRSIRLYAQDGSRKRPLNIMMLAKPGSGKSHFIKCLAENMKRFVSPVMFNMATLERTEELLQPLDAARNFKALDKLPLLFLDEFDSDPNKYPLLLPLLWDGELRIGHRELKLGRIVIVIAASGSAMNATMKRAKTMEEITGVKSKERKTIDLFSRINGGILEIPDLDPDRTVDKICLTISLLRHRFGSQLESAPWALLRFVALSRFRYGVRSITHLIDEIPAKGEVKRLTLADVLLPLSTKRDLQESGLAYHLISQRGAKEIVELWQDCAACESLVKFYTPQVEDDYL